MMHEVGINSMIEHVLNYCQIGLSGCQYQWASKLLGRSMENVCCQKFSDLGVVVEMSL